MVTDPPYGVNYDPAWRKRAGVNLNARKLGKVANDDRADWREAWALFPGSVAYVWHAGLHTSEVQQSLEASGFDMRAQIIWAKDRFASQQGPLSLAARALLVRGARNDRGALERGPQAIDPVDHQRPRGRRARPRHAEAGRVHAPADREQLVAGAGRL